MASPPPIKNSRLHFGCGDVALPGFWNVDLRATAAVDQVASLQDLLPVYTQAFDVIYLCHVFEHFPLPELPINLRCLHSLLSPCGKLYLSVPDFNILASIYLAGIVPLSQIVRAIHGGQEYPENLHYLSYDYPFLSSILHNTGFHKITTYEPHDFLPVGITDTSTYRIGGKLISLNIVCEKL